MTETRGQYIGPEIIKLEHHQNQATNRKGYLTGLAYDCYTRPDDDRASHYLARELMYRGFFEAAIKEFKRHIAMDKWVQEKGQSYIHIGDCYIYLNQEDKAVEAWHKAFQIDASRRESFMKLAEHYFKKNDAQRTAVYATAVLTIPNGNFYANNQEHYTYKPHELLYWAYWYMGDRSRSKDYFFQAFQYQPKNPKYLHDLQFYLPKVSIIVPTLGREEGLKRCLDSIKTLNYPQELIETIVLEGNETVPQKVKKGVQQSTGEYITFAANDTEFTPDSLAFAVRASYAENKALVAFHEGEILPDEGNICAHFIIKKAFIAQLENGELFSTDFYHVGVDNWLWAQAKKLNQAFHCEEAQILHYHFSTGKSEMDEVYKKGWEHVEEDRATLVRKLELLCQ